MKQARVEGSTSPGWHTRAAGGTASLRKGADRPSSHVNTRWVLEARRERRSCACGPEGEEGANKAVTVANAPPPLLLRAESFRAMAASNCCTLSTLAAKTREYYSTRCRTGTWGKQNLRRANLLRVTAMQADGVHSDTVIDGGLGGREGGAGRIDHRTYAIHAYACMIEVMRGAVEGF